VIIIVTDTRNEPSVARFAGSVRLAKVTPGSAGPSPGANILSASFAGSVNFFRALPLVAASRCAPSVFSVSLYWRALKKIHHKDTANTEVAQRGLVRSQTTPWLQRSQMSIETGYEHDPRSSGAQCFRLGPRDGFHFAPLERGGRFLRPVP
jgi:hypothetical protein